tara:strand:- start:980 stop:1561 length:582 start_codon:yes stop_codon:yes gene_type:complete
MRVLVACEYSGTVREAFAKKGHDAWSCDLLPTDIPSDKHIQGDCLEAIASQKWDLIIGHPPCTFLTVSNSKNWKKLQANGKQQAAIDFVLSIWDADCPLICIENPVGALSTRSRMGKPSQYVQPFMFNHPEQKKTGLWLKGLPNLTPTNIIDVSGLPKKDVQRLHYLPPSKDRWKLRSKTYQGIADAMADQWG